MSRLEIKQIPVLNDNYVYLAHCPETDQTAVVDPAVVDPVMDALTDTGWTLTHILNTHHHADHTGGNIEIKSATGCTIVGPRADRDRIPGIDVKVGEGDTYDFGNTQARVFDVPGHTRGHIAYWFEESDTLFPGDTLFVMGCGRLFEGTPAQMVNSLSKFDRLPDQTKVYCAHEYTQTNGRFALTVEPHNQALIDLMDEVNDKRARDIPTVPSTLGQERETNPFLRSTSRDIQETLGMIGADPVDVFAEVRRRKDSF